jgi:hypothetical protein
MRASRRLIIGPPFVDTRREMLHATFISSMRLQGTKKV